MPVDSPESVHQDQSAPIPFPRKFRTTEDAERATQTLAAIQKFVRDSFVEKVDYDVIPGTSKNKTLLKPGAEKIALFFDARPSYRIVTTTEFGGGHVEHIVKCEFVEFGTNEIVGEGDGSCSTMEKKYRWRSAAAEPTDKPVPREYWDLKKEDGRAAQKLLGGPDFTAMKVDGKWMIARKSGEKTENPDIFDERNTVLKMAEKRACVAAGLAAGCLSGYFTQDMEEHQSRQAAEEHDPEPPRERSPAPSERPPAREAREEPRQEERPPEGSQRAQETQIDPTRPKASLTKILSLAFRDDTDRIKQFMTEATTSLFGTASTLNDLSKEDARKLLEAVQKGRIKVPSTH